MPPSCQACDMAASRQVCGAYRMQCLQCCTRLVLSAHPEKRLAGAMLAAIARAEGAPSRADVLSSVEQELMKRRSAAPRSGTASSTA